MKPFSALLENFFKKFLEPRKSSRVSNQEFVPPVDKEIDSANAERDRLNSGSTLVERYRQF